ncbi:MAG: ABC transporter substrate-binding protein [bacterium]|nr:ABC transporter substrate-binding protein [bacterium]
MKERNSSIKKYLFIILVVIGIILSAIYIVIIQHQPTKTENGRTILHFWESYTRFDKAAMQSVVDDYNKSQDKYFVEMLTVSNPGQKLILAVSGGNPPDLCTLWSNQVIIFAAKSALMPLNKALKDAGISKADYIPGLWDLTQYKGFCWGLPLTPYDYGLYWNKRLFQKAGLDPNKPPTTLKQLSEYSDKLTIVKILRNGKEKLVRYSNLTPGEKKAKDFSIVQLGFSPSLSSGWQTDFLFYLEGKYWNGTDKILANSPKVQDVVNWYAGYAKKYGVENIMKFASSFGRFGSAQSPFITEKAAMLYNGSWEFLSFKQFNQGLNWDVAPFPNARGDTKNPVTVLGSDVIVIPRGSPHPKAAFGFIKFISSQKEIEKLDIGQGKFSPLRKVSKNFIKNNPNPKIKFFMELAKSKNARIEPKCPVWSQYLSSLGVAFNQVFYGVYSAKEALGIVKKRIQPLLDSNLKVWSSVKKSRFKEWGKENDSL